MGTSRTITEGQLKVAKQALQARVKALTGTDLEARRDPVWRKLDARMRQISSRLRKIASVEANNADLIRLKAEKAAAAIAEAAEVKQPKKKAPAKGAKPTKAEKADKGPKGDKSAKKDSAPKKGAKK